MIFNTQYVVILTSIEFGSWEEAGHSWLVDMIELFSSDNVHFWFLVIVWLYQLLNKVNKNQYHINLIMEQIDNRYDNVGCQNHIDTSVPVSNLSGGDEHIITVI